jgi:hypothetical protein
MPRDFDKRISSGKPPSVRRKQVHPGQQGVRGHTQAFRRAGSLQRKQSEAASFQQPVRAGGGTGAQQAVGIVKDPASYLIVYCYFSIHRNRLTNKKGR